MPFSHFDFQPWFIEQSEKMTIIPHEKYVLFLAYWMRCFLMIFIFSAKSLPNQKNVAIGRAGILKMETWDPPKHPSGHRNDSRELHDETQERQDGPSERPNDCPDGPWQRNLLLEVLLKANSNAPGSL